MEEVKPSANSRIRISSRRDVSFIFKAFQCDNGSSHHHLKTRNQRNLVQRRIWKPRNHIKKRGFEPIRSRQSWIPCPSENCAPRFSLNKEMLSRPSCPISSIFGFSKTSIWKYLLCDVMNLSASPKQNSAPANDATLCVAWESLSEDKRLKGSAY